MYFCSFCQTISPHLPKIGNMLVKKNQFNICFGMQVLPLHPICWTNLWVTLARILQLWRASGQHTMGLAMSLCCTWQTSLLVGFEETLLWVWRHYWSSVTMGGHPETDLPMLGSARLRYLWALPPSQHISHCHRTGKTFFYYHYSIIWCKYFNSHFIIERNYSITKKNY